MLTDAFAFWVEYIQLIAKSASLSLYIEEGKFWRRNEYFI